MAYAILRFQKAKAGGLAGRNRHHERKKEEYKSNPDIDKQRFGENYHIVEPTGTYKEMCDARIKAAGARTRVDSVLMVDTLLTVSPEYLEKMNRNEQRQFFERAAAFLSQKVGEGNVLSAVVHMDERNPHMHLCFCPITKDGRLCAKDILGNRADLSKWQDEYYAYMTQYYPDLKRGIPRAITGRKHIPSYLFKQAAELSKGYGILESLENVNVFNVRSVKKETLQEMGQLLKCATSLAAKTKETEDYIKSLEKEIERRKAEIAAQDRELERQDRKNESLINDLTLAEQDIRELQSQQRKAQKILDKIPPEVRAEIDKQLRKEARNRDRGWER